MKIVVVGDFYPNPRLEKAVKALEPQDIFGEFYDILKEADLSIVNLECPLTRATESISKTGPALKAEEYYADFLKSSGFNLATIANNHILDFGQGGLEDTFNALDEYGLDHVGAGFTEKDASEPYFFIDKEGQSLTVINCAEQEWSTAQGSGGGAALLDPVVVFGNIQAAKTKSDYVLVITHGGHENYNLPTKKFRNMLRFFVDAGADAVLNHHPHNLSGAETYKGRPIYYSLGNFLFGKDTMEHSYWNNGLAVEINFNQDKISTANYFFHQQTSDVTFKLLQGDESLEINAEFERLSKLIDRDEELEKRFNDWCKRSEVYYSINIEPHSIRALQALQNRNLLPSLWNRRKKLYLLNMLRCESHRELLIKNLEREISNT